MDVFKGCSGKVLFNNVEATSIIASVIYWVILGSCISNYMLHYTLAMSISISLVSLLLQLVYQLLYEELLHPYHLALGYLLALSLIPLLLLILFLLSCGQHQIGADVHLPQYCHKLIVQLSTALAILLLVL